MNTWWEKPAEWAGIVEGAWLAPLLGLGSFVRQARFFHPDGVCLRAEASAAAEAGRLTELGLRLAGPVLVRLSSAWWRGGKEWPDVLGCALRFEPIQQAELGVQDLLFATIPRPWMTPLAPLWTHQHDFLANRYYAVSPFAVTGQGEERFRFRLVPRQVLAVVGSDPQHSKSRRARLEQAVQEGQAELHLQAQQDRLGAPWLPVADLRLQQEIEIDQAALRFSPFRDGRGIQPRGFVHSLRRPVYALSQALRPRE